ncbi:piRNA biogenesis protein EXD1 [Megalops cyprinoides]|uniref:piRNA biogenesis protein EXD1 n=1 Tax=Megalops cyprinoides TaxID=118141 RepID=UPI001864F8C2|nr:piRNA biogenesis protein EXD1 [Megalops cyprinoides]
MDDHQFLESFKNKRIQITLKNAVYVGTVQHINLQKTLLLEDVIDVKNGRKLQGRKLFFGYEILNVESPNATKSEQGSNADCDHSTEGQLTMAEFQPYRKSIKLDDDSDDSEYIDFVVIDEFHEKFGPAVMQIRKQQVVGIGADGVGVFQHERLCWLQIATKARVYLFDILLLGAKAFKNGLSMILESNQVLKVAHDCRGLAGCLWTQYGVKLANVFDTQVADVMHFYVETGGFLPDRVSTLHEVVGLHLKMAPSCLASLKVKDQLTEEDSKVWYVRPCPASLLKVMALSVIYLQPLRLVLLDTLMSDYTGRVDSYLGQSQEEPVRMQPIGTSSGLELPSELRELERMRRERRQWARETYPVTEDGLLVRFSPRPAPPAEGPSEDGAPQTPPDHPGTPIGLPEPGEGHGDGNISHSESGSDRLTGSPGVTQTPEQTASRADPAAVAAECRPVQILELDVEKVTGRGRGLQTEGTPALAARPSAGRGLCLQIPSHISRELPGAGKPQPVGRMAEAPPGPAPPFPEVPVTLHFLSVTIMHNEFHFLFLRLARKELKAGHTVVRASYLLQPYKLTSCVSFCGKPTKAPAAHHFPNNQGSSLMAEDSGLRSRAEDKEHRHGSACQISPPGRIRVGMAGSATGGGAGEDTPSPRRPPSPREDRCAQMWEDSRGLLLCQSSTCVYA